jgi:hypothetical protein
MNAGPMPFGHRCLDVVYNIVNAPNATAQLFKFFLRSSCFVLWTFLRHSSFVLLARWILLRRAVIIGPQLTEFNDWDSR